MSRCSVLWLTPTRLLLMSMCSCMQALKGVPVDERCACKPNTQEAFDSATKTEKTCS